MPITTVIASGHKGQGVVINGVKVVGVQENPVGYLYPEDCIVAANRPGPPPGGPPNRASIFDTLLILGHQINEIVKVLEAHGLCSNLVKTPRLPGEEI